MFSVQPSELPQGAFLKPYAVQKGCYTDCYRAAVPRHVSLEETITAFFTTPVFRLERKLWDLFASRPSTTAEVEGLARGTRDTLVIWKVETREENQLIMAVSDGPIRTWLMVEPLCDTQDFTWIYFGSAFLPRVNRKTGKTTMGPLFYTLLGFHKVYSRVLLALTKSRL